MATVPAIGLAESEYFAQIREEFIPYRIDHLTTVTIDSRQCTYGDREYKYARATSLLFQVRSAQRKKAVVVNATYTEKFPSKDITQSLPRHQWRVSICAEFNPLYLNRHVEHAPVGLAEVRLSRLEQKFSMSGYQQAGSGMTYEPMTLWLYNVEEHSVNPRPRPQPWDFATRVRDAVEQLKPFASNEGFRSLRLCDFLDSSGFDRRYYDFFWHQVAKEELAKLVISHDLRDIRL